MIELLEIGIIGFFLLIFQKFIYGKMWHKHLYVNIRFGADHIFEGEQCELKEVIENRKRLPLTMLKVKFKTHRNLIFGNSKGSRTTDQYYRNDVFRIGGGERVTRTLKFKGGKRGFYTIEEMSLVGSDLFFLNQMVAERPVRTELYVYPKPFSDSRLRQTLIQLNGEMLSRRHLLEDPFEHRGIREYQPYDDMRSINWKATAKTGELMVNQKNYTSLKSVQIFFNIQDDYILKKEECVEMSLRIVATLCDFFLQQGIRVACYGNGVDIATHDIMSIKSNPGEAQMDAIYRALARIDTEQPAADFCESFGKRLFQESRGQFTCFVAHNQHEDFVELLTRYKETGNPFIWFYPIADSSRPEFPPFLTRHIEIIYQEGINF